MKIALFMVIGILMVGCSGRAVYENIQIHNRNECAKLPPSQYEECMAAAQKTYNEYEQERKE